MALTHLVDTSVLTRLARPSVRDVLGPLAAHGRAGRCAITDLEVGFSAGNAKEWDRLLGALGALDPIDVVAADLERARQVQRLLASQGLRGRKVPDLLVAACAERLRLTVLHYDADFDLITSATGQPSVWVVAKGSVD